MGWQLAAGLPFKIKYEGEILSTAIGFVNCKLLCYICLVYFGIFVKCDGISRSIFD